MSRFTSSRRRGAFSLLERSSRLRAMQSDIDLTPSAPVAAIDGHLRLAQIFALTRPGTPSAYSLATKTNKKYEMPGNPRDMITMAERTFPVRIGIAIPSGGLGRRTLR